jgi:death-associated protein 6
MASIAKRPNEKTNGNTDMSPPSKIRRIQPLKIGEVSKIKRSSTDDDDDSKISSVPTSQETIDSCIDDANEAGPSTSKETKTENEITKELKGFVKACRQVEPNDDMKKIIKTKLLKYYHLVHQQFVLSKAFRKMLENSALAVLKDPRSVYSKLQDIINELKSRKKTTTLPPTIIEDETAPPQEEAESQQPETKGTGDEKKDIQLKKLNKGLTRLRKEIERLEEEEVNWDDENSPYVKKVKYEKRAVEIYEKICDMTGESVHAHRTVKKPVDFKNSIYKEFNKKLTKKINKENGFPSYYDVYRLLDLCNKTYKYKMNKDKLKVVAEDAFLDVGKLLKQRRRKDLYESAEHWAGTNRVCF